MPDVPYSKPDGSLQAIRGALVTSSLSRNGSGVQAAARPLAQWLTKAANVQFDVFGIDDEYAEEDLPLWHPLQAQVFRHKGPYALRYSPALLEELDRCNPDFIHAHGIWVLSASLSARWASRREKPTIVSPHGMFNTWALGVSRWKKKLAKLLFEDAYFKRVHCFHALVQPEYDFIRSYGLRNPICVIPNGVEIPSGRPSQQPAWENLVQPGEKVLLFLSRLHTGKNLVSLLNAWHQARHFSSPWQLVIAGGDEIGHQRELELLSHDLGIDQTVHFIGPQYEEAKAAAFYYADAFILPSMSEALPMVVLEAWAVGLPVLMTPQCNLSEGFQKNAALEIQVDSESIARGLEELFAMTNEQRQSIGENGRRLVEEKFTWARVAAQVREVYDWMLGGGDVPETVFTNE